MEKRLVFNVPWWVSARRLREFACTCEIVAREHYPKQDRISGTRGRLRISHVAESRD